MYVGTRITEKNPYFSVDDTALKLVQIMFCSHFFLIHFYYNISQSSKIWSSHISKIATIWFTIFVCFDFVMKNVLAQSLAEQNSMQSSWLEIIISLYKDLNAIIISPLPLLNLKQKSVRTNSKSTDPIHCIHIIKIYLIDVNQFVYFQFSFYSIKSILICLIIAFTVNVHNNWWNLYLEM